MTEPAPAPAPPPAILPKLAAVLFAPLLAVGVLTAMPRKFDLWIDNGNSVPVTVEVQGRKETLPARSVRRFEGLRAGRTVLQWSDGTPNQIAIDVDAGLFAPRPVWLWNVDDRTPRYWIVSEGYGGATPPPHEPIVLEGAIDLAGSAFSVEVRARLLPGLDQDPPTELRGTGGGLVRSVLWSEHHALEKLPARVRLIVDGNAPVDVRLVIDGRDAGVVPARGVLRVENVAPGPHVLEAIVIAPGGGEGQRIRKEAVLEAEPLAPPAGWVWSPFGRRGYFVIAHGLGEAGPLPQPEPFPAPSGDLFRIPADLQPTLDEHPTSATVAPSARGVVLKSLWSIEGLRRAGARGAQTPKPQQPDALLEMMKKAEEKVQAPR